MFVNVKAALQIVAEMRYSPVLCSRNFLRVGKQTLLGEATRNLRVTYCGKTSINEGLLCGYDNRGHVCSARDAVDLKLQVVQGEEVAKSHLPDGLQLRAMLHGQAADISRRETIASKTGCPKTQT